MISFVGSTCRSLKTSQTTMLLYAILSALLILTLTACEMPNVNITPTPTPDPVPVFARPLLVQPEDMGWDGHYVENERSLDFNLFPEIPVEHMVGIAFSPIPISGNGRRGFSAPDLRGAGQGIYIYQTEELALQAFTAYEEFTMSYSYGGYNLHKTGINPAITNSLTECSQGFSTEFGEHLGCTAWFQHGRYLVDVAIVIDGEVVLENDWGKMLTLVQDKLVAHVEQESLESP